MYGMISKVKVKWFFCICMMAAFVCFNKSSVSAEDFVIGNSVFRYSENEDGTLYIYGYDGNDETVTVPSEIYGKPGGWVYVCHRWHPKSAGRRFLFMVYIERSMDRCNCKETFGCI